MAKVEQLTTSVDTPLRLLPANVILFGPPGVGKTELGRRLAARLDRPFVDVDERIVELAGKPVAQIFRDEGEAGFRQRERQVCLELAGRAGLVIACGGGALLDPEARGALEATGSVYCLRADRAVLEQRLRQSDGRPLLATGDGRTLTDLLTERRSVYDSFARQIDTADGDEDDVVRRLTEEVVDDERWERVVDHPPGYRVHVGPGLLASLPELLAAAGITARAAVVADDNVRPLYGRTVAEAVEAPLITIQPGESAKRLAVLERVQGELVAAGLDRSGVLLALGGGVVGDLAGMAAATYMRGIRWVSLPTTLLAMVDASIGGKVGVDLAVGKNLVGAFHPPLLVAADLDTLASLPAEEWRNGMAEVVKAALIGDAELFDWIEKGHQGPTARWVRRAQAVKIQIVERDPHERGERAVLNAGHTVGHALELLSDYQLAHGEAVALGLVAESELAVRLGLAEPDWPGRVAAALRRFGLPTDEGRWGPAAVREAMKADKKNRGGTPRFSLPVAPGQVEFGVAAPAPDVTEAIEALREGR